MEIVITYAQILICYIGVKRQLLIRRFVLHLVQRVLDSFQFVVYFLDLSLYLFVI